MPDPTLPSATPDFLNHDRAPVPDIVVARGLIPFRLRDRPVRGRLVRLGPLAHALLTRHENSPGVTALLGQALALTAGLAAALKFRGSFSLQAKGDGPVTMLLADCTDTGALRGYARADAERLADMDGAGAMLGKGYLAFTCDQGPDMDRYQGIVPIEGDTLAAMSDTYFRTSEQLRTHVHLAAAETPAGWRAAAFIMEHVASDGGIAAPEDAEEA
ncbi:MAG: Hsp33 family molecular chaperone HslO, partial [Pseudomonadota bacterium]